MKIVPKAGKECSLVKLSSSSSAAPRQERGLNPFDLSKLVSFYSTLILYLSLLFSRLWFFARMDVWQLYVELCTRARISAKILLIWNMWLKKTAKTRFKLLCYSTIKITKHFYSQGCRLYIVERYGSHLKFC